MVIAMESFPIRRTTGHRGSDMHVRLCRLETFEARWCPGMPADLAEGTDATRPWWHRRVSAAIRPTLCRRVTPRDQPNAQNPSARLLRFPLSITRPRPQTFARDVPCSLRPEREITTRGTGGGFPVRVAWLASSSFPVDRRAIGRPAWPLASRMAGSGQAEEVLKEGRWKRSYGLSARRRSPAPRPRKSSSFPIVIDG